MPAPSASLRSAPSTATIDRIRRPLRTVFLDISSTPSRSDYLPATFQFVEE